MKMAIVHDMYVRKLSFSSRSPLRIARISLYLAYLRMDGFVRSAALKWALRFDAFVLTTVAAAVTGNPGDR
jgi:hypothetical protein